MDSQGFRRNNQALEASMSKKSLIADNDRLIQRISCLGRCSVTWRRFAECGHHLIGRSSLYYRHDLRNIVPLSNFNHTGDSKVCAHREPDNFENWLKNERPEQHKWWRSSDRKEYHRDPNVDDLKATKQRLQDFLASGVPYVWTEEKI